MSLPGQISANQRRRFFDFNVGDFFNVHQLLDGRDTAVKKLFRREFIFSV